MPHVLDENEVRLYTPSAEFVTDLWDYVLSQEAPQKRRAEGRGNRPIDSHTDGLGGLVGLPQSQELNPNEITGVAEGISLGLNGYFSTLGRWLTGETNQELKLIYRGQFSEEFVKPAKKRLLEAPKYILDKMAAEIESQVKDGQLGNGVYWLFYKDGGVWLKPEERAIVQMTGVLPKRPRAKVIARMPARQV